MPGKAPNPATRKQNNEIYVADNPQNAEGWWDYQSLTEVCIRDSDPLKGLIDRKEVRNEIIIPAHAFHAHRRDGQ